MKKVAKTLAVSSPHDNSGARMCRYFDFRL